MIINKRENTHCANLTNNCVFPVTVNHGYAEPYGLDQREQGLSSSGACSCVCGPATG